MIEELRFKCPNCGSEKRVSQEVLEEDRKAGWIGDTIKTGILGKLEVPITDPKQQPFPGKPLSIVTRFDDICADCG